jgi:GMP reductase
MRINSEVQLDFSDVLIRPKRSTLSTRSEVSLVRTFKFRDIKTTWSGVPIMAANMTTVATVGASKVMASNQMLTCMHKFITDDDVIEMRRWETLNPGYLNYIALSCGTKPDNYERLEILLKALPEIKWLCLDVANGYSEKFADFIKKVRNDFPEHIIIAGNVATGEMTETLVLAGASVIKVGIGPGAGCLTRAVTGVGVPQLSAIIECADSAHGLGGHIIGDGGCTSSGDIAKAFGAGSDFVMLGSMLAGHEESGGEILEKDGHIYKAFYGMSSKKANDAYTGGLANYRASEGREVLMPYKGPLVDTLISITGGLRSTCTYIGAGTIKELPKCTTFIRVNNQINTSLKQYEIKG